MVTNDNQSLGAVINIENRC